MRLLLLLVIAVSASPKKIQVLQNLVGPWKWQPLDSSASLSFYGFSWKSCAGSSAVAKIDSLSVSPDPIAVPGTVVGKGSGSLSKNEGSPLKANVKLYKKAIVWIEIPCIDGVGSCTYDDVCELLENVTISNCPFASCKCPFPAGSYDASQGLSVDVKLPSDVPSWLANGDYRIEADLTDSSGAQVLCLDIEATLHLNQAKGTVTPEMLTRRWQFSTGMSHADQLVLERPCDPKTFEYTICQLNKTAPGDCKAGEHCQFVECPFPGQCWWPASCSCDPKTLTMKCNSDPTHKTECNTRDCGYCVPDDPKLQLKEILFRGARRVPLHMEYRNKGDRYEVMHQQEVSWQEN